MDEGRTDLAIANGRVGTREPLAAIYRDPEELRAFFEV
jgi:hypothetical protein